MFKYIVFAWLFMGLKRTLTRTSRNNYMVTVPKWWVELLQEKYGEIRLVEIDVSGDSLVVRPLIQRC